MKCFFAIFWIILFCLNSYAQNHFNICVYGAQLFMKPNGHRELRSSENFLTKEGKRTFSFGFEIQFFVTKTFGLASGINYNRRILFFGFERLNQNGETDFHNVKYKNEFLTIPLMYVWKPAVPKGNISPVFYAGFDVDVQLEAKLNAKNEFNNEEVIEKTGVLGYRNKEPITGSGKLGLALRLSTKKSGSFELCGTINRSVSKDNSIIISIINARDTGNLEVIPQIDLHYKTLQLKWFFLDKTRREI